MSEADKLFEQLGYKKDIYPVSTNFEKNDKEVEIRTNIWFGLDNLEIYSLDIDGCYVETALSMQELKAIYKKCEELGWI